MHVVVCLKQVLDQELPPRAFRVDRERRRPDAPGAALVLSAFDGNALELALKLREQAGEGRVTVLSLGPPTVEDVLRKALAVTADAAARLEDPLFEDLDSSGTALALAAAARRLDPHADVLLCGRQAGDWENGQVGPMMAEALGWPCLTCVSRIEVQGDRLRVRREVDDGAEIFAAGLPLCCTVTNDETNVLRLAKVRDVMQAHRKPIEVLHAADLGLDAAPLARRTVVHDLYVPERTGSCEFIAGPTPAAQAADLARRLRELHLV